MKAYSLAQHVADLGCIVKALSRPPVLIGHSLSGLLVQWDDFCPPLKILLTRASCTTPTKLPLPRQGYNLRPERSWLAVHSQGCQSMLLIKGLLCRSIKLHLLALHVDGLVLHHMIYLCAGMSQGLGRAQRLRGCPLWPVLHCSALHQPQAITTW